MLEISHRVADRRWQTVLTAHDDLFTSGLQAAFAAIDMPSRQFAVALSFVDDAEIKTLNQQYRQKDQPTNVLSFPLLDDLDVLPSHDPVVLGDIVLAFETIMREATEQRKPFAHHVMHLMIHGFLHLVGLDHMTDEEAADMEGLETEILEGLGVTDPYIIAD